MNMLRFFQYTRKAYPVLHRAPCKTPDNHPQSHEMPAKIFGRSSLKGDHIARIRYLPVKDDRILIGHNYCALVSFVPLTLHLKIKPVPRLLGSIPRYSLPEVLA